MYNFWVLIKSDYLQRTRSYGFLIALCATLALGYSFLPPIDAPYSTIRIGDFVGNYNCAWFGYVMAIMSSIFISLFGYFIINTSIKRDAETKVGIVLATTQTTNLTYLLSKMFCNILVLLSLSIPALLMGILLFFINGDGSSFQLIHFVKPYVVICLPMLVAISGLALLLETLSKNKSILQNTLFFVLFFGALFSCWSDKASSVIDPIGINVITEQMVEQVSLLTQEKPGLSIGFTTHGNTAIKRFNFSGAEFSVGFVVSRLVWVLIGFGFVLLSSLSFNRFANSTLKNTRNKKKEIFAVAAGQFEFDQSVSLAPNFSIVPLLKAELTLLFRNTNIWIWILSVSLMVALFAAPLSMAHKLILPILWFVHITKWSGLITKAYAHKMSLFGAISFNPIARLFTGQLLAGALFSVVLASPLIIKLIISAQWISAVAVALGALFVVTLAVLSGLLTRGRKLFEVLFFILIYSNLNAVKPLDFFGAMHSELPYLFTLGTLVGASLFACYAIKYLVKN